MTKENRSVVASSQQFSGFTLVCLLSASVVCAEPPIPENQQADEFWNRYTLEAPEIAGILKSVRLRLESRREFTHTISGDVLSTSEWAFFQGFQKHRSVDRGGIEKVIARNDGYAFAISKAGERTQYAINWLEPIGGGSLVTTMIEENTAEALAEVLVYWYVFGIPFYELATSDSCKLTGITTQNVNGREYLKVEFEMSPGEGSAPSSNYALLDGQNNWVPIEVGSRYSVHKSHPDWTVEYNAKIEYGDPANGLPIGIRKDETWTPTDWTSERPDDSTITQEIVTTVSVLDASSLAAEEFYLSHYGLPEPNFEVLWLKRWWVYLLGAILCGTAAYYIKRRRRSA